ARQPARTRQAHAHACRRQEVGGRSPDDHGVVDGGAGKWGGERRPTPKAASPKGQSEAMSREPTGAGTAGRAGTAARPPRDRPTPLPPRCAVRTPTGSLWSVSGDRDRPRCYWPALGRTGQGPVATASTTRPAPAAPSGRGPTHSCWQRLPELLWQVLGEHSFG